MLRNSKYENRIKASINIHIYTDNNKTLTVVINIVLCSTVIEISMYESARDMKNTYTVSVLKLTCSEIQGVS